MSAKIDLNNLQNNNLLLLNAVQRGDLSTVLGILAININLQQISGLVYSAVARQDRTLVWNLLIHGANPNEADQNGITPLILAISLRNIEIIHILINGGAEVNPQTFEYATFYNVLPFLQGALANQAESDEEFYEEDVSEEESDQELGEEPADFSLSPSNTIEELTQQLFLAIQQGNNDRVEEVLLVRNTNQNELLNARDENNNTPLMLAIMRSANLIIQTLIATTDETLVNDEIRALAREYGMLEVVEEALGLISESGSDSENRMSP